jgi:hypothetical protein
MGLGAPFRSTSKAREIFEKIKENATEFDVLDSKLVHLFRLLLTLGLMTGLGCLGWVSVRTVCAK